METCFSYIETDKNGNPVNRNPVFTENEQMKRKIVYVFK